MKIFQSFFHCLLIVIKPDSDPFLLLAKQKKDAELLAQAHSQKTAPKLVSVNDQKLNMLISGWLYIYGWLFDWRKKTFSLSFSTKFCLEIDATDKIKEKDMEFYAIEDLRAIFLRLAVRMQNRLNETDAQQNEMNLLAKEITQMQNIKR